MAEQQDQSAQGLRRLLACPDCKLQYDVGDLSVGSRFRCSCGRLMTVVAVKAHHARVVRCSSCGAPRRGGAAECGFCGADFTLHERDLQTICPGCLTRISDQARFCHFCGVPIVPQATAGAETEYGCPSCPRRPGLTARKLGDSELALLECGCCGGTWVGHELFDHLQESALQREASRLRPRRGDLQPASISGCRYRRCPLCNGHMSRRNFGRRSGVIVDICPRDGIWLDCGELDGILKWIREGGLSRAREAETRKARERSRPFPRPGDPLERAGAILDEPRSDPGEDFLRGVIAFFS